MRGTEYGNFPDLPGGFFVSEQALSSILGGLTAHLHKIWYSDPRHSPIVEGPGMPELRDVSISVAAAGGPEPAALVNGEGGKGCGAPAPLSDHAHHHHRRPDRPRAPRRRLRGRPVPLRLSPHLIQRGPLRGHPKRIQTDRRYALGLGDLRRAINAMLYAESIDRPLNTFVTVIFAHADAMKGESAQPYAQRVARFRARFLERLRAFLVETTGIAAYIWAAEHSGTPGSKGFHLHIAVHLRDVRQRKALERALRPGFSEGGILISGVRTGDQCREGFLTYTLKRTDHRAFVYRLVYNDEGVPEWRSVNVAEALSILHYGSDSGAVPGQRLGVSHAINRAARRASGWRELRRIEEWADALDQLNPERRKRFADHVAGRRAA